MLLAGLYDYSAQIIQRFRVIVEIALESAAITTDSSSSVHND